MASKWISEDAGVGARKLTESYIERYSNHVYFNKDGLLDKCYTARLRESMRWRHDRIFVAGEPEWQQRYQNNRERAG